LGAEKGERTAGRQGYRSAITAGPLITRVGKLVAGTAGSNRTVLDRAVRALSALAAGAGGGAGGDVRFDAQSQSDHQGAMRPQLSPI
jgi:hypothetical protein